MVNKNLLKLAERWKNPSLPAERETKKENKILNINRDNDQYVFVPSTGLHVAKQRTLQRNDWFDQHKDLQKINERMQVISEFIEFLKSVRENNPEIYEDITAVRSPGRAENLDAYFEQRDDGMYILTGNKTKAEKLDPDTLMEDRTPGISIGDWLQNSTKQGFPSKKTKSGDLYYWYPRNGSVARFDAGSVGAWFGCGDPGFSHSSIGVFACAEGAQTKK